jgi:fluoride exporter
VRHDDAAVSDNVDTVDGAGRAADIDVEAIDPDVDLHVDAQRHELDVHPALVLGAIAAGGVLGSEARYALTIELPDAGGRLPWTTLAVNVGGCLLMGVVMVLVGRWAQRMPLLRPFLAVGVLGGFTTFSAYAVGVERLLAVGRPGAALAYVLLTPVLAVPAVVIGARLARAAFRLRPRGRRERLEVNG